MLVGALVLGCGVIAASVLEIESVAIALVGALIVGVIFAVAQLRRRVGEMRERLGRGIEQIRRDVEKVRNEFDPLRQRQIVAAVENERLAAAERQEALLSRIGDLERELSRLRYVDAGETLEDG